MQSQNGEKEDNPTQQPEMEMMVFHLHHPLHPLSVEVTNIARSKERLIKSQRMIAKIRLNRRKRKSGPTHRNNNTVGIRVYRWQLTWKKIINLFIPSLLSLLVLSLLGTTKPHREDHREQLLMNTPVPIILNMNYDNFEYDKTK